MNERYGVDTDGNRLIDLPNTWDYAHPAGFTVRLDASGSCAAAGTSPITSYAWEITGNGLQQPLVRSGVSVSVPDMQEGQYHVKLTVTAGDNRTAIQEEDIFLKDWLIVAMGDSYGSGEGNPVVPQVLDSGFTKKGALWADGKEEHRRCHRSTSAASSMAALAAERRDPHSSVTFIFVACSGGTISTPIIPNPLAPEKDWDWSKNEGSGVLDRYRGIEPASDVGHDWNKYLPSQIEQVASIVGDRHIDALTISAGGNDLHFASIIEECAIWDNACPEDDSSRLLAKDKTLLPGRYAALNEAITSNFNVGRVFITEYPDPTLYNNGKRCEAIADDIIVGRTINSGEQAWAVNHVIVPLNQMVNDAANNYGWRYVDGIMSAFGQYSPDGNGYGHGYCATAMGDNPQRWMRTAAESAELQGPDLWRHATKGTMHPNELGHAAISKRIQLYLGEAILGFTGRGDNVPALPRDAKTNTTPVTVTFDNVSLSGVTSLKITDQGPASPSGYKMGSPARYYDVSTTATFNGEATVCISYDATGLSVQQQELLRVLHYTNGAWEDRTILPVDTTNKIVCARTTSFSPFAIMQKNQPPTADAGAATLTVDEGTPIVINATASDPDGDALTFTWTPATHLNNATVEDPTFTGPDNGAVEKLTFTARDAFGGEASDTVDITVQNVAPVATFNAPTSVSEGQPINISLTNVSDLSPVDTQAGFTYAFDCGAGYGEFSADHAASCATPDNTIRTVKGKVQDKDGGVSEYTAQVQVVNLPPVVTIIGPTEGALYAVNTPVRLNVSFTDAGIADTHTCVVNWDDSTIQPQSGVVSETNGSGTCTLTRSFPAAGVYTVNVTVTDDDQSAASKTVMVVVYDPSAGFVTGGGWLNSAKGSCQLNTDCANAEGKANFGFVSKYQKGTTVPSGKTEFQFHAGNFNFESETYEWLVVAGAKAQYKGVGSVNGKAGYAFLLTATDGQVSGGGGFDKLRMKVWDKATGVVVYDNQASTSDDIDKVNQQQIGGGSIIVHSGK